MASSAAPQAPIIVLAVIRKTDDELTVSDSTSAGLFLGIVIVVACVLVATAILAFINSAPAGQLSIYYEAFASILVFSGIIFIVGAYLLLSFSEKRIGITKSSGRIVVVKRTVWGSKTLATYGIEDVLRIEWRNENNMERVDSGRANVGGSPVGVILRQPFLQPQQVLVSQAVLILRGGKELLLASTKRLSTGQVFGDIESSMTVINQIALFLGIPLEDKKAA